MKEGDGDVWAGKKALTVAQALEPHMVDAMHVAQTIQVRLRIQRYARLCRRVARCRCRRRTIAICAKRVWRIARAGWQGFCFTRLLHRVLHLAR